MNTYAFGRGFSPTSSAEALCTFSQMSPPPRTAPWAGTLGMFVRSLLPVFQEVVLGLS